MKFYDIRQTIAAPPERVWQVLTDAKAIVAGGLGVARLEGEIKPGARLKLWSAVSPGRGFSLRVTEFVPNRRMVWVGGMPLGLFRGERQYNLTPMGGNTEFHMREEFSGPMLALIGRSIPDLTPSFEKFADGLQALAEGASR
jgi:hypothetical protein